MYHAVLWKTTALRRPLPYSALWGIGIIKNGKFQALIIVSVSLNVLSFLLMYFQV